MSKTNWPVKKLGRRKSFNEIVHSWLKDEWYLNYYDQLRQTTPVKILEDPDFSNADENKTRLELLRHVRKPMVDPLPNDTEWYIINFNKEDLSRTFIVPSADWLPLTNNTFHILEALKNVESNLDHAGRIREIKVAIGNGNVSKNLILVASNSESFFTVIEGNHRAVAFAGKALENSELDFIVEEVFLGISPQMKSYIWHIESRFPNEN